MNPCVLVINPGSTSTKVAVFTLDSRLFEKSLSHSSDELSSFKTVASQYGFRRDAIIRELRAADFDTAKLTAVVGRGGLLHPIPGGVYKVNGAMKKDLTAAAYGEHASNLGALIADDIAKPLGIPAYIVDPVVVDELSDLARVSGNKLFERISIFHALNQKAVARRYASEQGRDYEDLSLIVAHLGGGISVGLHRRGKVEDVNNALNGEGPFSPERSGTLPTGALVKLCFSGKYGEKEINRLIAGAGGMVSFLGTNDMRQVEKRRNENDAEATLYYEAFIYQVSKAIGALAAAASGKVDAVILTGGIAYGKGIVDGISRRCAFIAPIVVYPGEGELEALAQAGFGALSGSLKPREYLP
ncbi:Butyrate kinase 2 [bioreactor metagenome]|jgi:butyrate kinase|uniref:Butyrate kinase 2 n=1 Tax=bioreactor metagenome TaxID=1076179 RepID=A0A644SVZ7_9ZZZZ|nr:butyrate kinase [Spirochaetales bacterium]NLX45203.1 butyrate kinase [Treponema sp.]VBB41044.1 Butyrate kinase [uncultured Spirochaetota bacterium]HAP55217.1 butyrate kinase [Spirochaetaceae bacterium]HOI22103.1 butyrate kinase [Spirochaetales bacterium]